MFDPFDLKTGEPAGRQSRHHGRSYLNNEAAPALRPEEWAQGLSFADYIATMDQFKPMFMDGYHGFRPPAAVAERLESLRTQRPIAILSGGHCPDCHDFLPVFVRLAELSPRIEVRVFPRHEHPALAERFATDGKHYIPTGVVMDPGFHELGRFVERPRLLKEIIASGADSQRAKRRGAYQIAAADEILNLLLTSP